MLNRKQRRHLEEQVFKTLMRVSLLLIAAAVALILITITVRGMDAMSLDMITRTSEGGFFLGGEGGVLNAIAGSFYLSIGATAAALVVALPVVLYLHAYSTRTWLARAVRLALDVLWGIPSIVYGAFGFTVMLLMGIRASLLGGVIALALVILPIMVRTMDEVMLLIPHDLRESAYALGITRLEMAGILIRHTIPGLFTAVLLAFGRGIGDAASVLFTAGFTDHMPQSLLRPVASLPLAVFFGLSTPFPAVQERAYAAALILLIIVLVISLVARIILRLTSKYVIR